MKKLITAIAVLALCLSLCACGKSEAVKNVESMIDALGEVTSGSADAIEAIENAYNALAAEEQAKVSNYAAFVTARDHYYAQILPGSWCYSHVDLYTVVYDNPCGDILLNPDMTWSIDACGSNSGTWQVSNGEVILHEDTNDYEFLRLNVCKSDGIVGLGYSDEIEYVPEELFYDYLSEYFLVLDLSEIDPNEYFDFIAYEDEGTDEWGDPTGNGSTYALLHNKLYDEGWLYLSTLGDFAIEVLIPEYNSTTTYSDGYTDCTSHEAGSVTITWSSPFTGGLVCLKEHNSDSETETDLNINQLSIGRSKGQIVFVNSKYVTAKTDSDGNNYRYLVWEGDCYQEYYVGEQLENIEY